MFTKYTVEEAQTRWGVGAPDAGTLEQLLAVSWEQCVAYAPLTLSEINFSAIFQAALDDEDPESALEIPAGHREAHFIQARNIWNATLKAPGASTFGPDGMAISLHPLDWHVKQLLRPRTAVPKVR
ncbi:hypothetical protein [Microbacterium sp. NPDC091662]|uniref:hypothetical protein n=1 Tax=Microbacterium sp. NPDC091662 TaxID=3364211 RepID=UPI0038005052